MKNENKTQPTDASVKDLIATLPPQQQDDANRLVKLMSEVSGQKPILWGTKIVGFGTYHYKSNAGREGDWMKIGFAPGKGKLSLYLVNDASEIGKRFNKLGKYKTGKGCLYINKLEDVDIAELKKLLKYAYDEVKPFEV